MTMCLYSVERCLQDELSQGTGGAVCPGLYIRHKLQVQQSTVPQLQAIHLSQTTGAKEQLQHYHVTVPDHQVCGPNLLIPSVGSCLLSVFTLFQAPLALPHERHLCTDNLLVPGTSVMSKVVINLKAQMAIWSFSLAKGGSQQQARQFPHLHQMVRLCDKEDVEISDLEKKLFQ